MADRSAPGPNRRKARSHRQITAESTVERVQDLDEPERRTVLDLLAVLIRNFERRGRDDRALDTDAVSPRPAGSRRRAPKDR